MYFGLGKRPTERDPLGSLSHEILKVKYSILMKEHNNLIRRINKLGGEQFLQRDTEECQFDSDELKELVVLCHPDKHGGSTRSEEMTKRINTIRSIV